MGKVYRIWPNYEAPFAANVELDGQAVILQSRGPKRNPGYEGAFYTIVKRLVGPPQWIDRVLIDSVDARQAFPDSAGRTLLTKSEIEELGDPALVARAIRSRLRTFNQLPGTKGGNSTKQVRFETSWAHSALRAGLSLRVHPTSSNRPGLFGPTLRRRLTAAEQNLVQSEDVQAAVARLLAGEDTENFAPSRDFDVITAGGDRLAPKKVFGFALEEAEVVVEADWSHFAAGNSQPCFRIIRAAGYEIFPKDHAALEAAQRRRRAAADQREVDRQAATVGVDAEERSWIEGDKRMATHLRVERRRSAKAAKEKRAAVRAANAGRLACEHCDTDWYAAYPTNIAEAIFDVHHTKPLKDMDEGHETRLEDLLCLCANCHRAEHRSMALDSK